MNDRAMARHSDIEMFVAVIFDANNFVDVLCFSPSTLGIDPIVVARGNKRFDVKILNICSVIGESPRDAIVVANDNHRRARQSEAFDVPARRSQVHLVPDGRDGKLEMSIVGKQRLPGGGMCAAHNPVVAPESLANLIL